MNKVDWFLEQAEAQVQSADELYWFMADDSPDPDIEHDFRLHLFCAWALWRVILTYAQAGQVLSAEQEARHTTIKFKFVQFSAYLPDETSELSI